MDLLNLVESLGAPLGLAVYFIWRDKKNRDLQEEDKEKMEAKMDKMDDFIKKELMDLNTQHVQVIERNTTVMKYSNKIMTDICKKFGFEQRSRDDDTINKDNKSDD